MYLRLVVFTSLGVVDQVSALGLTVLQVSVRHGLSVPLNAVVAAHNGEVSEGNLSRSAHLGVRNTEELSLDLLGGDLKLKVSAVVSLGPHQRLSVLDEALRDLVGGRRSDVLAEGGGRADARSAELHTDGTGTALGAVGAVVEPGQVANPVDVGVTSENDVVANVVLVEGLQGAVLAGQVAVPSIHVEWRRSTVQGGQVQLREDCNTVRKKETPLDTKEITY